MGNSNEPMRHKGRKGCEKMEEPGPEPFGAVDESVGKELEGRREGEDGARAGRGSDGVKRARAEFGTSGSEGREAAAALTKKEATVRADRLMVPGS